MGAGGVVPCVEGGGVTSSRSGTGDGKGKGRTGERQRDVVVPRVHVPRGYAEMHLLRAGAGAGGAGRGMWD